MNIDNIDVNMIDYEHKEAIVVLSEIEKAIDEKDFDRLKYLKRFIGLIVQKATGKKCSEIREAVRQN